MFVDVVVDVLVFLDCLKLVDAEAAVIVFDCYC